MYAYGLIKAMPPRQSHLPQARATHIPDRIQQEMDRHMQQTLPANLQYYQKSGGYVPPHIQQEMAQHMQSTMPEHLKQYINPYMQQTVVSQHLSSPPSEGQIPNFIPHHIPPPVVSTHQDFNTFKPPPQAFTNTNQEPAAQPPVVEESQVTSS